MENTEMRDEFLELLKSTDICENGSKDDRDTKVSHLNAFITKHRPTKLYRYRSIDSNNWSIDAFENDTARAMPPSEFNDPHDSLVFVDRQKIKDAFNYFSSSEYLSKQLEIYIKSGKLPESVVREHGKDAAKKFKGKQSSIDIKKIIQQSATVLSKLADDIENSVNNFIKILQNRTSIICLTETPDSNLMWAHYADDHTGFVLEYENIPRELNRCAKNKCQSFTTCPDAKTVKLFPIVYSEHKYDATESFYHHIAKLSSLENVGQSSVPMPDLLYSIKANIFKSPEWAYEKEWRLLCNYHQETASRLNKPMCISDIKPSAIYYGVKINPKKRDELSKIAITKNIAQFQMEIDIDKNTHLLKAVPYPFNTVTAGPAITK